MKTKRLVLIVALVAVTLSSFAQNSQIETLCEFEKGKKKFVLTLSFYGTSSYITHIDEDSEFTNRIESIKEPEDNVFVIKVQLKEGFITYRIDRNEDLFSIKFSDEDIEHKGKIIAVTTTI
jgi:hypothetical protein